MALNREAREIDREWTVAVVTECQRFVCATAMDGTVDDGPPRARQLREALPVPPDPMSARFLRGMLFELAVRWGAEQHRRLAPQCRTRPCAVLSLIEVWRFWPSDLESDGTRALDSFVGHVTCVCDELTRTHDASLAQRAAALFSRSGGATTVEGAARELGTHPSTLRRAFRREIKMTAREYLARVRFARAEALLLDGQNAKVEPIAYEVGWSSKSGLYRAFRQFRDETPGRARNAL